MIDEMTSGEPLVITFTRVVQNQAETVLAPSLARQRGPACDLSISESAPAPAPVVVEQPAERSRSPGITAGDSLGVVHRAEIPAIEQCRDDRRLRFTANARPVSCKRGGRWFFVG